MDNRLFSDHTNVECPKCGCWRWGYIGDECRSEGCDGVMCKKAFTSKERSYRIALEHVRASAQTGTSDAGVVISYAALEHVRKALSDDPLPDETSVPPPGSDIKAIGRWETLVELSAWVDSRIEAEVAHRPDVNIHKRTLADTWGQMQRKLEGMLNQGASAPSSAQETSIDGCRYPMSGGRRCDSYPNCVCGTEKASAPDWVTITVQCAHCGAFASSPESCDHTVGCPTLQVNGGTDGG